MTMNRTTLCIAATLAAAAFTAGAQEAADPPMSVAASAAVKPADPEATAAKVSAALKSTEGVPTNGISVTTHAATVVLSGEVNSEAERAAAQAAAESAASGARISSNIQVRPLEERPLKDQQAAHQSVQIVRDVEAALQADARTANLGIAVTTADAKVVVLQGLVAGREQRAAAQTVAASVKGVVRVDNRLLLPGDALEGKAVTRP
jgi:osmotically-inducible protein OsmY